MRCGVCGGLAAGPCARCRIPLCGDCCVISAHGANQWAVCRRCHERGGSSLRRGWLRVGTWLLLPLVVLAALVVLLALVAR